MHLLEDLRELAAAACHRQPQRRDGDREVPTADRRSAVDLGLGKRELSGCDLQPPVVELACRVSQRQVGMIG